jgi:general secretion pathway protein K
VSSPDARRGVILVTVLWSIALLSALAMAASTTFRGFVGVMAVDRDRVQAGALLTAGLETTAGLMANGGDTPLNDGIETTVTLSTGSVHASASDEGGRIDIGKAPVEVLAALFRAVAGPAIDADMIARSIVAWREPSESDAQPPPDSPDERPFSDVRQLADVREMAPEWVAAVLPLTTVWGSKTVNPLTAPAAVIAALPGVDQARLAAFLAARGSLPAGAQRPAADRSAAEAARSAAEAARLAATLGPAQRYLEAKPQRVASVRLTARLLDGTTAAAQAVIAILPQDSRPYRVLVWNPLPSR